MKERKWERKKERKNKRVRGREAVKASMCVLHAHVTLVSWSLMEEQTQIPPQGPALHLSLSSFHLLHKLPLFHLLHFHYLNLSFPCSSLFPSHDFAFQQLEGNVWNYLKLHHHFRLSSSPLHTTNPSYIWYTLQEFFWMISLEFKHHFRSVTETSAWRPSVYLSVWAQVCPESLL